MDGLRRTRAWEAKAARAAAALLALIALTACSATSKLDSGPPATEAAAETPPPAPPPAEAPPPVDIAGRWKLAAASGGACYMTLGAAPAATAGTVAPEGGCPGNFFTSRKWAYEHNALIIRDFKGVQLAQLSFVGGHFEGQTANGSALTLSR